MPGQRDEDAARQVEDDVVGRAGEPDDDVVLRRRQLVAVGPADRLVEPGDTRRRGVRGDRGPQLRPEAGDEVDAADRRPRLPQRRHERDRVERLGAGREVELEVRVRVGAEREDARLR